MLNILCTYYVRYDNIYIYTFVDFYHAISMSCSSTAPLKQLSFNSCDCCVMPWAPSSTGTPRARIVQHLRTESHIKVTVMNSSP